MQNLQRNRFSIKTLLMVTAAGVVLSGTIGGTVAWLVAKTNTVTNTFTYGDIDITLEETPVGDGDGDDGDDTKTYEFRYYDTENQSYIVNAANAEADLVLEPLFEEFTVPGSVTSDQIQTLQDLKITVVGHAVQAVGFGDPVNAPEAAAEEAWSAFDQQYSAT